MSRVGDDPGQPAAAAREPRTHRVRIAPRGQLLLCAETETLLQAMTRAGCRGIPAGCRSGGCGVCRISVGAARVRRTGPMSRAHVSAADEARGVGLACRLQPLEDLELEILGRACGPPAAPFATRGVSLEESARGAGAEET